MARQGDANNSPYGGAFAGSVTKAPNVVGLSGVACKPVYWTISSGTQLSWADGRPAGTVRRAHQLAGDPHEVDDRVCFDLDGLQLCTNATTVGRRVDPDCATGSDHGRGSGAGFGGRGKRVPQARQAQAPEGGVNVEVIYPFSLTPD